ncbi:MAG: hypothetical protein HYV46_02745 [candidate division NC10 bacterium]|nr:hypothetical protein [candidate division NC10 bacterium]
MEWIGHTITGLQYARSNPGLTSPLGFSRMPGQGEVMVPNSPLTLEGLAEALRTQGETTDRRIEALTRKIDDLAGQVEGVIGLFRDVGRLTTTLAEQHTEHREQILQILHRLERHDAQFEQTYHRLEAHDSHIRRILDLLERRGGDGGPARV